MNHKHKVRIGELLVRQGRLAPSQLKQALELQAMVGGRLGTNLLELGLIEEPALLAALGEQRASRTVSGEELRRAHPQVVRMIRHKLAERYRIVPFEVSGKTLSIASVDPVDPLIEDEIRMLTSTMVRSFVAAELRIAEALALHFQIPMEMRYGTLVKRLARPGAALPDQAPPAPPPPAEARPPSPAPPSRPRVEGVRDVTGRSSRREVPGPAPAAGPPRDEPRFIELDAEDEALLLGSPSDRGAAVEASPNEIFPWLKNGAEGTGQMPAPAAGAAATDGGAPAAGGEDLEERLEQAANELQRAEIRDEIADVLLDFCAPFFKRRMLLIRRQDRILGWRAEGDGIVPDMVRAIEIDAHQPSVFVSVSASGFWLGPLPPLAPNRNLVLALGEPRPRDCVVLPITMLSKIVCYLYGDNLDGSVAGSPLSELRRLAAKAGIAFEVYVLKNKIRML